jgi:PAP2 superfamily
MLVGLLLFIAVAATTEISRWNQHLLNQIAFVRLNPPAASRQLAMLHVAQFEAANSVAELYEAYLPTALSHPTANPELAAAKAARDVLNTLYPANQTFWDAQLDISVAAFSGDAAPSLTAGAAAASAVIANRTGDGSATAGSGYTAPSPLEPGDWRPTAPAFASYLLPSWGLVKTWVVTDPAQRAASVEPPALDSLQYANELEEVRLIGAVDSTTRTAEESLIARVWAAGGGTVTPPGQWFQIAQQITGDLTFMEQAQTYARLGVAVADSAIVCWTTKFNTQLWRPITALREGGYPTWSSYIGTPPFPAHTSGHSTFSGAAARVLRDQTGSNSHPAFTVVSGADSRTLTHLTVAADEAAMSRIYGGIHFESDSADGLELGVKIGKAVRKVMQLKADL